MIPAEALKAILFFVSWVLVGFFHLIVAARIEGIDSSAFEENDKIYAALVVLWPILLFGLVWWFYREKVKGEII